MRLKYGSRLRSFLALEDTPASYLGQALRTPRVNAGETALEFAAGVATFLGLTDTPATYVGQAAKAVKVNALETALEFGAVGGDWAVISEVDVGVDCDYVDFLGLDINTDKAYALFIAITNPQASDSLARLFINGDYTVTNYYRQYLLGDGASVIAARINDSTLGNILAGTSFTAPFFILRDPQGYARLTATCNYKNPAGLVTYFIAISTKAAVVNLTSLRVAASLANGIGAGSHLLLCRPRS